MATNKHAIIRYQALDKCFSNRGRRFYIDDLIEACNNALYNFTGIEDGVKRRQIFDDITFMESEEGYSIPLERCKDGRKVYYRYDKKEFSINSQPLSPTEIEQLKNTIFMLNRFKGLPKFEWMDEVVARFESAFIISKVDNVVSFEQNPYLKGLEHFSELFNAIVNKQVLNVNYQPFPREAQSHTFHPYHLKQYNNRWFLFGLDVGEKHSRIMNMAIDRIISFEFIGEKYIENEEVDFAELFEDVVGVTILNKEVETILLKIDNERAQYIETKPLHPSQIIKERGEEYVMIQLQLIPNYEFETLLLGFADSIDIIAPQPLKERISQRAKKIFERNI
ncbi:MAG: WYL domain-containing protein [Rikenellaceae bacterium]